MRQATLDLRRVHGLQELIDLTTQLVGLTSQIASRLQHLVGRDADLRRRLVDIVDGGCHLLGAGRRLLAVAVDLTGRSALFFDGQGYVRRDFVHLGDLPADIFNGRHRLVSGVLDRAICDAVCSVASAV